MNESFDIKKPHHLIALFVVLFILLTIPLTVIQVLNNRDNRSKAAFTTNIYVTPGSQSVNVNGNLDIQIRENSGTTQVTTADIQLTYDNTRLDFLSLDPAVTSDFKSNEADGVTHPRSINESTGQISFTRWVNLPNCDGLPPGSCPDVGVTGDKLIATLHFKALQVAGTANLNILNTSTVQGDSGDETLNRTGGTYTIVDPLPVVNITSPSNNSFQKGTITVTADATDNLGVTKVEFIVDGGAPVTDTTPDSGTNRYSFSLNTTSLSNSSHSITAKAYDANCSSSTCPTSTVTIIVDNLPPTISISGLPSKLKGSTTVTANVSDTNIDRVEFRVDSGAITTDNSAPTYTYVLNTATLSNGSHTLTATAFDKAGNSTPVSQSFTSDNQGPGTSTLSGTAISETQINLSWTSVTDALSGPVTYDVYRNGTKLTSSPISSTTYSATGLSASTTYSFVIRASDTLGNTTDSNTLNIATKNPPKEGDFNGDGLVNSVDLTILISTWGSTTDLRADANHDNIVSSSDLARLIAKWGS